MITIAYFTEFAGTIISLLSSRKRAEVPSALSAIVVTKIPSKSWEMTEFPLKRTNAWHLHVSKDTRSPSGRQTGAERHKDDAIFTRRRRQQTLSFADGYALWRRANAFAFASANPAVFTGIARRQYEATNYKSQKLRGCYVRGFPNGRSGRTATTFPLGSRPVLVPLSFPPWLDFPGA